MVYRIDPVEGSVAQSAEEIVSKILPITPAVCFERERIKPLTDKTLALLKVGTNGRQ